MGNFFCDCNRNTTNNIQQRHIVLNSMEHKHKKEQNYPSSIINNNNKTAVYSTESTLNEICNNNDDSIIISKGKGQPEDKYNVISTIGQGSYGIVYKIMNKTTNELYTMKTIPKQNQTIHHIQKQIIKEIEFLEQIDHPNIIKIHEFYDLEDKICIISELCEGSPLSKYKGSPEMSSELEIAIIMFQLLSAINYCHNNNIIHRDIKPNNILIDNKHYKGHFNIKLTDFGTAKLYINPEKPNIIGSTHFTAPEVLNGTYAQKSDLWSCGVLLYYLLTTKYPFDGNDNNEIYTKIKNCVYDKLEGKQYKKISSEAKDFVYKLIKVDYNERLSANQALEHIWFNKLKIKDKLYDLNINQMKSLLNNIFTFNVEKTLQIPVINYIVHNNLEKSSYINYAGILFNKIDINNDGCINKNEFIHNINLIFSEFDTEIDKEYLIKIFDKIDIYKSNKIGYTEFVGAAVDRNELLTENILKEAFCFFDKDNSGTISLSNIKHAFSTVKGYNDNDFTAILEQINLINNDVINLKEFTTIMKAIIT